jgi:hypothetical protein
MSAMQLSRLDIEAANFERQWGWGDLDGSPRYQQRERLKNRRAYKRDWCAVRADANCTAKHRRMFRDLIAETRTQRKKATS